MTVQLQFAPIRGITSNRFLSIFSSLFDGVDSALAPFIKPGPIERQRKTILSERNDISSCRFPIVPQFLAGNNIAVISTAALFFEAGYTTVNWNLGCPWPMVTRKMQGAGLLPHPQKVAAILEKALPGLSGHLSIKTRLGMTDPSELANLLPLLTPFKINELIVHGRIASQMYEGHIHLDRLQTIVTTSPFPVVLNGDIYSVASFQQMQTACPGVSRFMIGRGLLRNPFLAQTIKRLTVPVPDIQRDTLRRFHDELFTHYRSRLSGDAHLLSKMAAHWEYFNDWFSDPVKVRRLFRKVRSLQQYDAAVHRLFGELALSKRITDTAVFK